MKESINPFRLLGVAGDCTDEEVRLAWQPLARKHHPDKGGAQALFATYSAAYAAIKTPVVRAGALARLALLNSCPQCHGAQMVRRVSSPTKAIVRECACVTKK